MDFRFQQGGFRFARGAYTKYVSTAKRKPTQLKAKRRGQLSKCTSP
jgi:hypothetical protein